MIVTLKRVFCPTCSKIRWHEVAESAPCCVVCENYQWGLEVKPVVIEFERFTN